MHDDPHFEREKSKYDNPVASREYLLELLVKHPNPLSFQDICQLLNADDEQQRIGIQRRLRAMEREGQVIFNRQKQYQKSRNADSVVTGKVIGHRDGFGFLKLTEGGADLYIPAFAMKALLPGDTVNARKGEPDYKGRVDAKIVEVVQARQEPIVGRLFWQNGTAVVIPDDSRITQQIVIAPEEIKGASQGQVVVVDVIERPQRRSNAQGRVLEVLGEHMAPGMEIEMAIRTFEIPYEWPQPLAQELAAIPEQVPEEAYRDRVDLRQMPLLTIDGEDARDFDDAVYCQPREGGGWTLWVAIADVSHYVRPDTALDKEAQQRGNSVYFPANVVPMLPEKLSNGLCSLNPNVDRLCMVCEMHIGPSGGLKSHTFYQAVMCSKARLTYTSVWAILQGDNHGLQAHPEQVGHLQELHKVYQALKKARRRRGAIEFETQESQFVFNAARKIADVVPVVRNPAHMLIEECMIMANVAAALTLLKHKAAGLYRIHNRPDPERMQSFLTYLRETGVEHGLSEDPTPKEFSRLLGAIADRPDSELMQTMLLRSMQQAVYSNDNVGHFGLSLKAYAHFTSPIRRYPDLLVHRALKAIIDKTAKQACTSGAKAYTEAEAAAIGQICSMTERRADDATRDVADWLKCEYMQQHIGSQFEGIIVSVTHFGVFVRLRDLHIDGLVHITSLTNDYYRYDQVRQCLTGDATGFRLRLGDVLTVRVSAVNLDDRKIDFVLQMPTLTGKKANRRARGKSAQAAADEAAQRPHKNKNKQSKSAGTAKKSKKKRSKSPAKSQRGAVNKNKTSGRKKTGK